MIGLNIGNPFNPSIQTTSASTENGGFSLQFDGSQNYATLGTLGSFASSLSNGFFCKFDIKTTQTTAGVIFGGRVSATNNYLLIKCNSQSGGNNSNKLQVQFVDTGNHTLNGYVNTININDGNVHHVEITMNMAINTIRVFFDGNLLTTTYTTQTTPVSFSNFTKDVYLGVLNNNGTPATPYLACTLDNLQLGIGNLTLYNSTALDKMRAWNYSSNYLNGSSTNEWYVESAQIPFDMSDIAAAGVGVVKIYADETNAASHLAALDQVAAAGLKAIVLRFITYNVDYSEDTGAANRTAAIAKFTGMISNLMGHSAVIAWGFGNENNASGNRTPTSLHDWYTLLNTAIGAGKAIDNTRPYFTAEQEVADMATAESSNLVPNIDIWGANIYRGTTFTDLYTDIKSATSKPFILTEFGVTRPTNGASDQTTQANQILALIQEAESYYPVIRGWAHFKFTDTVSSGSIYGATAAQAQGVDQARTKYTPYTTISTYCTGTSYLGVLTSTPYAIYSFNEGVGTTFSDSSGNANTGTLLGSPVPTWVRSL